MAAGRRAAARNSPRSLDIDLLVYGHQVCARPELTLPHPRLRRRRFYLVPLEEIAPRLRIPPDGATVAELAAAPEAVGRVERLD
jgi:7,8-dihydro-6-hydroxymethylpterin-pyrophosphokinase